MYPTEDENKHRKLIDDLKNLKKIEAPVGFESKLWNKINANDAPESRSIWNKISLRLAPAAAVLATAAILFVIIDNNASEYQDPFMIEPEERKDIIEFSTSDLDLAEPEVEIPEERVQEKSSVRFRKKEVAVSEELSVGRQIEGRSEAIRDEDSIVPELSTFAISDTIDKLIGNEEIVAPAVSVPMQQNLNFRQIQLSEEEQREVIELKSKTLKSDKSRQK